MAGVSMETGIVIKPSAWLYAENRKNRIDEIFMGWAVGILGERDGFFEVITHYGYKGYIEKKALLCCTCEQLRERDRSRQTAVIKRAFVDVMQEPTVQSRVLLTLCKGSFLTLLPEESNGYRRIELSDGQEGYIPCISYQYRMESDGYFYTEKPETYFRNQNKKTIRTEHTIRELLAASAKNYLGTQYRWAGKSGEGIDCSGLTFMCYLMNGILIYRDAELKKEYPLHEISLAQIDVGDLLYFPRHVAMYIGNQRYIHATANERSFGCVINSLSKQDFDYRKDLAESILMAGSVFT